MISLTNAKKVEIGENVYDLSNKFDKDEVLLKLKELDEKEIAIKLSEIFYIKENLE